MSKRDAAVSEAMSDLALKSAALRAVRLGRPLTDFGHCIGPQPPTPAAPPPQPRTS